MNNLELINKYELELSNIFKNIDNNVFLNSQKVLNAFHAENISESDFASTTGYGFNDVGRDKIERIYASIFGGEDALVRSNIISGTHALTITLFGILRPNDELLYITGTPYDTLHEVIGIKENYSSLKSFGIKYNKIDLINNDFDYNKIKNIISERKIKVIAIQRSKGYSTRNSINMEKVKKVAKLIKEIDKDIIIMVDNCYCEFVENISPLEVGCDLIVGSLIKNMGAGMCDNGGYIVGKKDLIWLISERLNVPGEGKEVGPSNKNKDILKGLYFAPLVVGNALKVSILFSKVLNELGYVVSPKYDEERADIVLQIEFNNKSKLIEFCNIIQSSGAVDSNALIEENDMPGYEDKIAMASGSFVSGSSIELSCDGPLKEPFIAYLQGSLTYEYGKLALLNYLNSIK